jgi:hypothetical protein
MHACVDAHIHAMLIKSACTLNDCEFIYHMYASIERRMNACQHENKRREEVDIA